MQRSIDRRGLLAGSAALGIAVALPWMRGARATSAELRFGLTPVFLSNDLQLLDGLRAYLSRATARPVRLIQRRTYQEITTLLVSAELDAAWICGYPYVRYRDQLRLLAVPVWRKQPLYQSYLIVDAARPGSDFSVLRGDVHAFSDPDSNSGYLVTATLLAERNLRPTEFFSRFFYTYGHRNVVRAVASGLAQSGSVDGYVWEVLKELEPDLASKTRILHRSEWLGFPPVAAPRHARDEAGTRALGEALVNMHADADGQAILHMLRLDGFEAQQPALFDRIAENWHRVQRLG